MNKNYRWYVLGVVVLLLALVACGGDEVEGGENSGQWNV